MEDSRQGKLDLYTTKKYTPEMRKRVKRLMKQALVSAESQEDVCAFLRANGIKTAGGKDYTPATCSAIMNQYGLSLRKAIRSRKRRNIRGPVLGQMAALPKEDNTSAIKSIICSNVIDNETKLRMIKEQVGLE